MAVATDDGVTVSRHLGRAEYFLVFDLVGGVPKVVEKRPKPSHQHPGIGHADGGHEEGSFHERMLLAVSDCQAVVAGGMGWGMYEAIRGAGKKPYVTDLRSAEEAMREYIAGTLTDHTEMLH